MLVNCKNGISSYELHRALGVSQKAAWFMLQRLRLALQDGSIMKLGGSGSEVEVDETFVGAKARNMHKSRKDKIQQARSHVRPSEATMSDRYLAKTAVMGMLDREARKVRAAVVPNVRRSTLQAKILNEVEHGSKLYTDQAIAYDGLASTNGIENFWSLLKRGLNGTYVAVEPFHLFRYVDEQVFRFNNRNTKEKPMNDADRFQLALSQVAGKRLTFAEVTGKVGETKF
jgi:transposase-like protein